VENEQIKNKTAKQELEQEIYLESLGKTKHKGSCVYRVVSLMYVVEMSGYML
jgi:hypothetical protein